MSCQNCQKLNWNCGIIIQVMVGGDYNFPALAKGRVDIFPTCCQGGLHIFTTFKFIKNIKNIKKYFFSFA